MKTEYIEAVRSDKLVGRGSCASIDECYSDAELWELIKDAKDPKDAVKLAREDEGLFHETGLNQRWGEDDDPQLASYNDWQTRLKEAEGAES